MADRVYAAAGSLTVIVPLFLLQDDDNFLKKLGEFLTNIGEYLWLVANDYLPNIPKTGLDILLFFFGDNIKQVINAAYEKVLSPPTFQGSIFWGLIVAASILGGFMVALKAAGYLLNVAYTTSPVNSEYTLAKLLRGETPLVRPDAYFFERLLPTLFIVGAAPFAVWMALWVMYQLIASFALAVFGNVTPGEATFELMVEMVENSTLVGFTITFGLFAFLYIIFLIVFVVEFLVLIISTIVLVIQTARYGDGTSGFEVVRRPFTWVSVSLVMIGATWLEVWLFPLLLDAPLLSFAPVGVRVIGLLGVAIATPPIVLASTIWVAPKVAYFPIALGRRAKGFIAPEWKGYEKYPEHTPAPEEAEAPKRPRESAAQRAARIGRTFQELQELYGRA